MQDDVVALFAYDRWANTKILDACRELTAEQFVAEPVLGWSLGALDPVPHCPGDRVELALARRRPG